MNNYQPDAKLYIGKLLFSYIYFPENDSILSRDMTWWSRKGCMIRHQILLSLIIVTAWFPFNGVRAVEVLTAQELALHCKVLPVDRESADGQYCIRYIQGFIDGAVATDVRVMMNLEAELAHKETFSERAMRVRGPDLQRAAGYAEFCLGDPLPLLEVVEKVVADLTGRERIAPKLAAREFVYASLRKHYPCNKVAR